MKKSIITILTVLFTVAICQAANPSWSATDASPWWVRDSKLTAANDTLVGDDSTTLWSNFYADPGWNYILQYAAFSGTSADSAVVGCRVIAKDENGTVFAVSDIDTADTSVLAGEAFELPIGESMFGIKYDIKFMSSNNDSLIVNKVELWKRKAEIGYTNTQNTNR